MKYSLNKEVLKRIKNFNSIEDEKDLCVIAAEWLDNIVYFVESGNEVEINGYDLDFVRIKTEGDDYISFALTMGERKEFEKGITASELLVEFFGGNCKAIVHKNLYDELMTYE